MPNKVEDFFSSYQEDLIVSAIKQAESNTSGEIRVHLESYASVDPIQRVAKVFQKLGMHKTKLKNGILFHLAIEDRSFTIYADVGIHKEVSSNYWQNITEEVLSYFKKQEFSQGLCRGIYLAGIVLGKYFPKETNNPNELPDEISKGL